METNSDVIIWAGVAAIVVFWLVVMLIMYCKEQSTNTHDNPMQNCSQCDKDYMASIRNDAWNGSCEQKARDVSYLIAHENKD